MSVSFHDQTQAQVGSCQTVQASASILLRPRLQRSVIMLQGNQAQQLGGGLALAESPGVRLALRSGTFTENFAGLGGGMHADNETEASCMVVIFGMWQADVVLIAEQPHPMQYPRSSCLPLRLVLNFVSCVWT